MTLPSLMVFVVTTGDAHFCEYNVITWTQRKSRLAKIGGHYPSEDREKLYLHMKWSNY